MKYSDIYICYIIQTLKYIEHDVLKLATHKSKNLNFTKKLVTIKIRTHFLCLMQQLYFSFKSFFNTEMKFKQKCHLHLVIKLASIY